LTTSLGLATFGLVGCKTCIEGIDFVQEHSLFKPFQRLVAAFHIKESSQCVQFVDLLYIEQLLQVFSYLEEHQLFLLFFISRKLQPAGHFTVLEPSSNFLNESRATSCN
jgi:hypothetical protein